VARDAPFLTKETIEGEAASLLAEYGVAYGPVKAPSIPIDDIVEPHLKLTLEFKDLRQMFGYGDVHGAIWINERRVGVDLCLDPTTHPAMRGRYHFTLAHKAGHWRLHRHLFLRQAGLRPVVPDLRAGGQNCGGKFVTCRC
jgi:hypothetical protein